MFLLFPCDHNKSIYLCCSVLYQSAEQECDQWKSNLKIKGYNHFNSPISYLSEGSLQTFHIILPSRSVGKIRIDHIVGHRCQ